MNDTPSETPRPQNLPPPEIKKGDHMAAPQQSPGGNANPPPAGSPANQWYRGAFAGSYTPDCPRARILIDLAVCEPDYNPEQKARELFPELIVQQIIRDSQALQELRAAARQEQIGGRE